MKSPRDRIRLPIDAHLGEIQSAVTRAGAVILSAPPGTGKTTRVPPALARTLPGQILVLEPRRLAAKLSAQRIAEEEGWELGKEVGYQFRLERRRARDSRVVFLTEGMFLRELQSNPRLDGVSLVVLDEFHERHLQGDFALGFCERLRRAERPDLKLMVMSATLEQESLRAYLPEAALVEVATPVHPLEISYEADRPIAEIVRELPAGSGDVLVFLPGGREIRQAADDLARERGRGDLVLPLYGDLDKAEQDRVFEPAPSGVRKIILSTNIAETSLTIPGVRVVVDSGVARVPYESHRSGFSTLKLKKISRASAIQRAGRAARQGPGQAIRLYAKGDYEGRAPFEVPEIQRLDLSEGVLQLASSASLDDFPWYEKPDASRLENAKKLLGQIGALEGGRATELGRALAALPLHPRLGRIWTEAKLRDCADEALKAIVLLQEEAELGLDFLEGLRRFALSRNQAQLLERYRQGFARSAREGDGFARGAKENGGFARGAKRGGSLARDEKSTAPTDAASKAESLARALLAGYPDRVALRRGELLLLASGEVLPIPPGFDRFHGHSLFLCPQIFEAMKAGRAPTGLSAKVNTLLAVEEEWLWELEPLLVTETIEREWDEKRKRFDEYDVISFLRIPLSKTLRRPVAAGAGAESKAAPSGDRGKILETLFNAWWDAHREDLDRDAIRFALCRTAGVPGMPAEGEASDWRAFLRAKLAETDQGESKLADLGTVGEFYWGRVPPAIFQAMDEWTPTELQLPGARKRNRIYYEAGSRPRIEARMQELFGVKAGPTILKGREKLLLHVLAPNYRAVQVTDDLAGFWARHYPELRKEYMRRYPKHAWPENPAG